MSRKRSLSAVCRFIFAKYGSPEWKDPRTGRVITRIPNANTLRKRIIDAEKRAYPRLPNKAFTLSTNPFPDFRNSLPDLTLPMRLTASTTSKPIRRAPGRPPGSHTLPPEYWDDLHQLPALWKNGRDDPFAGMVNSFADTTIWKPVRMPLKPRKSVMGFVRKLDN
jgi:hypothetical protein